VKFGPVPLAAAKGGILAHSLTLPTGRLRKGRTLSSGDIAALDAAGIDEVTVARLGDDDLNEDQAAERVAAGLVSSGISVAAPFTGRANLHAEMDGVLEIDTNLITALNRLHEDVTLATLANHARVSARQMIATVKIIPYAVPASIIEAAEALLASRAMQLHPFTKRRVGLILTETEGGKASLVDKAEAAVQRRLDGLGARLTSVRRVAHATDAVAEAVLAMSQPGDLDLMLIFGASATSDRSDVCPAGLIAAGGALHRFGMPVDPGNLLFLGQMGTLPVLGMPGCARSPALNGADWVLERLIAGLDVSSEDIAAMGVGGLLKEIPSRPQPRAARVRTTPKKPRIEAVLLAGGRSTRMRGRDKLLEEVDGAPLLRLQAQRLVGADTDAVHVILPENMPKRLAALAELEGITPHVSKLTEEGMAGSIRAGLAACDPEADGILFVLGDMPDVSARDINAVISAFDPDENRTIIRACDSDGVPGHPVLFGRRFFESLATLSGDEGARRVIKAAPECVVDVPTSGFGATTDLDTPESWEVWRASRENAAD